MLNAETDVDELRKMVVSTTMTARPGVTSHVSILYWPKRFAITV